VHAGVRPELSGRHIAGVRRVTAALAELEPDGWLILHELQRPGRRFASIDHVAVGPGGIVVIDTKGWAGTVEVVGGVLHQSGISREREADLAAASAASVTALLEPAHRSAVRSVLCLVDQPTPSAQPAATSVYGLDDLTGFLRRLPHRLRTDDVWAAADLLSWTLAAGPVPVQLTTAALATSIAEDSARAEVRGWMAPGPQRERLRNLRRLFRGRP
jgi:hypothetical protein